MTATATSISSVNRGDLITRVLNLPAEDFWRIVELRLTLPPSSSSSDREYTEYLAENALVEEVFLQLACNKKTAIGRNRETRRYTTVTDYKYYRQALELLRWIPVARPPPEFVVHLSDLSSRVIAELKVLQDPREILKQAVGRIFENIDPQDYHLSVASQLRVRLAK